MLRGPLGSVALLRGMLNPILGRAVATASVRYADDNGRKKSDGMFSWLREMLRPEETYVPRNPGNPSNPTDSDSNPSNSLDPWAVSNPKNPSSSSNPSNPSNPSSSPKPTKRSSPSNSSKSYYSSNPGSVPPPADFSAGDIEDKGIIIDDVKKNKDSHDVETIQPDINYPIQSGGSPTIPKRQMKSSSSSGDTSLVEDPQTVNFVKGDRNSEEARIQAMRKQELLSVQREEIQQIYESKNYAYLRPEEMKNLRLVSRPRPTITESNATTTTTTTSSSSVEQS